MPYTDSEDMLVGESIRLARRLSDHLSDLPSHLLSDLESVFRRLDPVNNCDEGMLFRAISRYCAHLKGLD